MKACPKCGRMNADSAQRCPLCKASLEVASQQGEPPEGPVEDPLVRLSRMKQAMGQPEGSPEDPLVRLLRMKQAVGQPEGSPEDPLVRLLRMKQAMSPPQAIEVELKTGYVVSAGLFSLFFLGIAGAMVALAVSMNAWIALLFAAAMVWLAILPWLNLPKLPRTIDQEGITKRNGSRVHWNELTKTVSITGRAYGVRVSGGLRLHFGDEVVLITPNAFRQADQVVDFVGRKTRAYPG